VWRDRILGLEIRSTDLWRRLVTGLERRWAAEQDGDDGVPCEESSEPRVSDSTLCQR